MITRTLLSVHLKPFFSSSFLRTGRISSAALVDRVIARHGFAEFRFASFARTCELTFSGVSAVTSPRCRPPSPPAVPGPLTRFGCISGSSGGCVSAALPPPRSPPRRRARAWSSESPPLASGAVAWSPLLGVTFSCSFACSVILCWTLDFMTGFSFESCQPSDLGSARPLWAVLGCVWRRRTLRPGSQQGEPLPAALLPGSTLHLAGGSSAGPGAGGSRPHGLAEGPSPPVPCRLGAPAAGSGPLLCPRVSPV